MELWAAFRRFWGQEEVPRWIGLSLVALVTIGMGASAWTALLQGDEEARSQLEIKALHSAELLAEALQLVPAEDRLGQERLLRKFQRGFPCSGMCVVDDQRSLLASAAHSDAGSAPPRPEGAERTPDGRELRRLESEDSATRLWFRLPLRESGSGSPRFLEGELHRPDSLLATWNGQASTLAVMLGGVGLLFLLYRRMRRHFRGVSRIADNLTASPDLLVEELDALRLSDSLGAVAQSWNQLIDLVEELKEETSRSAATDELRRVLEQSTGGELANALHVLPDALLYITDAEQIRYANSKAMHLIGQTRDEDEGRKPLVLDDIAGTPLRDGLAEIIRKARGVDGVFSAANEFLTDEQEGSTYRVRALPLVRQRGGECLVVVADVSQQVRADRAREDFVSQVTHELRTPLTNIRAYAETLSSGMFEDPKVITDCYNVITKETRRLSRLIEDILSISQMEAGNIKLVPDPVDVRELISDAVRDVRGLADEKNIDLQMDLPSKLGTIEADRDKLAVVLNNLLGNALKYTPAGGKARVGCKMTEQDLVLTVKDNGIGIAPEEHERVFEKFQRSADPVVQDEAGTGIGLTTAREIVRRHGGEIELFSAKGEGSTFVVKIPMRVDAGVGAGTY